MVQRASFRLRCIEIKKNNLNNIIMGHKLIKSELLTVEEMKFSKENFRVLQELALTQIAEIKTLVEQYEQHSENHKNIVNLLIENQASVSYLNKILQLRDKKVSILKKKVKYLKFRRTIEITVNDVKNAE